jgi:hypothetical protein
LVVLMASHGFVWDAFEFEIGACHEIFYPLGLLCLVAACGGGDGAFYQSRTIQKITWPALMSTTPWLQRNAPWFAWLIPAVLNGRAVMTSEDASAGGSVPQ